MRPTPLVLVVLSTLSSPAWARRPPLLTATADPCHEVCMFSLCPVGETNPASGPTGILPCATPCGPVQVSIPANEIVVSRFRIGQARVRLRCEPNLGACLYCHTDADCDDGDPDTIDKCSGTIGPSHCEHLRICPCQTCP